MTTDADVWAELRRLVGIGAARMLVHYARALQDTHGSGSPGLILHIARGRKVKDEVVSGRTVRAWIPDHN